MGTLYPAHIRYENGIKITQSVRDHCISTACYAEECLKSVGLGKTAYLAGILHDCGKLTNEFREYIEAAALGKPVKKGSVNHTFAGVKYILDEYHHDKFSDLNDMTSEIVAYAIGAHHGLFDCIDENNKNGFIYRQEKQGIESETAIREFVKDQKLAEILKELFGQSKAEIETFLGKLAALYKPNDEMAFYYGLLCRLVLSAVIEGDRRDTEEFMLGVNLKEMMPVADWQDLLDKVETQLKKFSCVTEIDKARAEISRKCYEAATKKPNIYRLNVPTGGGKTLASLRYALRHAKLHNKKHIIYTMPLLSIIEQNSEVLKDFIGNDEMVLEHHSNVVNDEVGEQLDRREFLVENWDAPIIVTTLVQFLYTLFKGKTTSIRRFKSLCDSVIIFDEVQTVPPKMLTLFNLACNFLSTCCNATIILCSATQPCLESLEHNTKDIEDLINIEEKLLKPFERVNLMDKGDMTILDIERFVEDKLGEVNNVLVVCNTKKEANLVYSNIQDADKIYLSANMCMAHRNDATERMRAKLTQKKKFVCVSTQVIEAGVDVSFECVIRFRAGMDSIIQAAGRCNRHGELNDKADVYIVNYIEENLAKLREINDAKVATTSLLIEHNKENSIYDNLMSDASIRYYYHRLYKGFPSKYCDFYYGLGDFYIYDKLAMNKKYSNQKTSNKTTIFTQAFKSAGKAFEVFEQDTTEVVVPYKKGRDLIRNLFSDEAKFNLAYCKKLISECRGYTVSIYEYQKKHLLENGGITYIESCGTYVMTDGYYSDEIGIVMETSAEDFII